jgi:CDP-glucose 4,6-dehydratase
METMVISHQFWQGRRVFVSGHTGFKGSWLCLWLHSLGAEVHGYALPPATEPSLFRIANVDALLAGNTIADVRDAAALSAALARAQPEFVFHLAAQPLVRRSYVDPVETYATNVMGTVHLLQVLRDVPCVRAAVIVTTDKCYENREWTWGYRESDRLGGHDPYSSSKACVELVTDTYRRSFFTAGGTALASARAGNVIGGGDWATDRLVPDVLHAFSRGEKVHIRYPAATRPWQHVLEPLSGYLTLAARLVATPELAGGWNFGPERHGAATVADLVARLAALWGPSAGWVADSSPHPHEAGYLMLDIAKADRLLRWTPRWSLDRALSATVDWHKAWLAGADMRTLTLRQIAEYEE